jgi:hypothetical protein
MATINVSGLFQQAPRNISSIGNENCEKFVLAVDAAGKVAGVDIATGDVIRLGIIPAGYELLPADCTVLVPDAFGTGVTAAVGFAYVDGVDVAGAAAQDADYFVTATSVAAQGIIRGNNAAVQCVTLPKDAYLTVTFAGTSHDASAARMEVLVRGTNLGA